MSRIISFNGKRETLKDLWLYIKSSFKVLSSGNFILGKYLEEFEKNFSNYLSDKKIYSVGVNSCTDALYLSLKLYGIGKGDEVITQSNTAIPTANAIVMSGATPMFVDVDSNYQINIDEIEKNINENTKAVIVVNLFGDCTDLQSLRILCKKYNIKLIEDCAQSFGGSYRGKKFGTYGDVSCFSFYPTKILGGIGDGGMVVCKKKDEYERLKRMRFHGIDKSLGYYTKENSYNTMNSRLDEIHACILNDKLKKIDTKIQKRKKIAEYYQNNIKLNNLILPSHKDGSVYYNFVVRYKNRKKIIEYLRDNNIFVNINYPFPIHKMEGYRKSKKTNLKNTELFSKQVFNLPIFPTLKKSEMKRIVKILNQYED